MAYICKNLFVCALTAYRGRISCKNSKYRIYWAVSPLCKNLTALAPLKLKKSDY